MNARARQRRKIALDNRAIPTLFRNRQHFMLLYDSPQQPSRPMVKLAVCCAGESHRPPTWSRSGWLRTEYSYVSFKWLSSSL